MVDSRDCDRCNATILSDEVQRPFKISLPRDIDSGADPLELETRQLCCGCQQDLLDWIDGDYQRENAVELPPRYETGETFREFADVLEDMADEME